MSGIAARDLKNLWNIPIVHMFHTLGLMKQRVARDDNETEGAYRLDGEREVLEFADRIVAATPAELAQLQWLYQADTLKIRVIPPGVDTSHFYPIPPDEAKEFIGAPQEGLMLLFVGRIEPLKGIDSLLRALSLMRERGVLDRYKLCMSIIGGDPHASSEAMTVEMSRLHKMREQQGLKDFVTFLGRRSQDTLPYYYSAAETVVVPSHYESFGMVALESMACGTPVVASQVGGLAFLVQDGINGYHVPVDDTEVLCNRLITIIEDRELRMKMSENAATFALKYAWEKIADQMIRLYQEVIGQEETEPLVID
jgi:D-inositol-3-phosphate glycosyltransferase